MSIDKSREENFISLFPLRLAFGMFSQYTDVPGQSPRVKTSFSPYVRCVCLCLFSLYLSLDSWSFFCRARCFLPENHLFKGCRRSLGDKKTV